MLQARDVSKFTNNDLDFHICNALIKASSNTSLENGVTRNWLVSEIERAANISDYTEPFKVVPDKISKRLTALHKLNIIKNRKSASKYKWFYNTGITLDNLIETQAIKEAVIDIEPDVIKPEVVITTVPSINPNIKAQLNKSEIDKSFGISKPNTIKGNIPESANILNIKNNNIPRDPSLVYYFVRYKALYRDKAVLQTSDIIAVPFKIYTKDHQTQIENCILEKIRLRILTDEVQMVLLSLL